VANRTIDRYAMANDASHYLLIPKEVAAPKNISEITALLHKQFQSGQPLTFRSGGTSLSGQGVTNELLVDTRSGFRNIEILDGGKRIRVQPGVSVREVNNRLKSYGYKFGPDPASEIAATIGGVIANNSSGMLCGTEANAYQTIESMKIIFSDGTLFDTASPTADKDLVQIQPLLHDQILAIKKIIDNRVDLQKEISRQFAFKNTMGYGINSFIDFQTPTDILLHLLIGSEGTLAFVSEATFRTVPIKPFASSALLFFDSLRAANDALPALVESGAAAIELLDKTSLLVGQRDAKAIAQMKELNVNGHAGFIVEYQELTALELQNRELGAVDLLSKLKLSSPTKFTQELRTRNDLWHVRKSLYAAVAGARPWGTTALLEDIAVPVNQVANTCESLTNLFEKHKYRDSVIFGHAKNGNIHFMLNEDFTDAASRLRYERFTNEMVDLVLADGGTLKAEHGTGRIMAPFVERQYGAELYSFMVALKKAFDPKSILNPDVIITTDSTIHLKNFKTSPRVEEEVDRCVECGFCEQSCPSKNLTLTPRQRIVIRRAISSAKEEGNTSVVRQLNKAFQYDGIETCAADGICAVSCPVSINTGDLVKRLRSEQSSPLSELLWKYAANNWSANLSLVRAGISTAHKLPLISKLTTKSIRGLIGSEAIPYMDGSITPGKKRIAKSNNKPDLIYLPSCTGEIFGPSGQSNFEEICAKAGLHVYIPEEISNTCCGTPWKSKGMKQGSQHISRENKLLADKLASLGVPVVSDNSSCSEGFIASLKGVEVLDAPTYLAKYALEKLSISKVNSIMVHPTCSSTKLDESAGLMSLANALSGNVIVPPNWGCCAFAGDRGLLHPELTKSATKDEVEFIHTTHADAYISTNRTCEIAMTNASGKNYIGVLELLNNKSN
jgi:D-lactate dehydrogenase